jgi:hypothetical protein
VGYVRTGFAARPERAAKPPGDPLMICRFLCLGMVLVLLLGIPACGSDGNVRGKNKGPVVPDPDGDVKPSNAKAG